MSNRVDYIWLFLKPGGRLTRWPYFLATMLISLISSFVVYRYVLAHFPDNAANPWETPGLNDLLSLIFVVTLWPMIALSAKRLQDIGKSPYLAATIAIPMISLVAYFALSLYPGMAGPNAYGARRNEPPGK